MSLPGASFAVAALVVLALPGIIFAAVRRWLRGELPEDRDVGLAFARGTFFAIALNAIYLVAFGPWLFDGLTFGSSNESIGISDPRAIGAVVLIFYVMTPVVVSILTQWQYIRWIALKRWTWMKRPVSRHGYTSMPTAWDHAVRTHQHSWIKVLRADGSWVGGWFTGGSFAATYPEPRTLYIDQQYVLTAEGDFDGPMRNSGVWIALSEGDLVFWTRPDDEREGNSG